MKTADHWDAELETSIHVSRPCTTVHLAIAGYDQDQGVDGCIQADMSLEEFDAWSRTVREALGLPNAADPEKPRTENQSTQPPHK